jgi:DNA-directed RNA polymerase subunit RPC12/RpoP
MVKPTPMFEVTLIEVKPMEMPNIRCPNCKQRVVWSPEHMNYKYGSNDPLWLCKERKDGEEA